MRRRLFNLAAAMSLVFLAAVACFAMRSAVRFDSSLWRWSGPSSFTCVDAMSGRGIILVQWSRGNALQEAPLNSATLNGEPPIRHSKWRSRPLGKWDYDDGHWQRLGFTFRFERSRYTGPSFAGAADIRQFLVIVPYWFLLLMTALLPLLTARRRLRSRRRRGCCQRCSYDLRVTPERCPEFGPIAAASSEKAAAAR